MELHPESAPTSGWNWFLSFAIDDAEFDAFVAADLSTAAFEDVRGVFEAHVKLEDIPAYLARRLKAAG
ncbi:hypothetical protein CU254_10340 [Amycolatopsis sp. AA4]|nr:hypothetical protein CU254_10340 [Amycolatopsis sp. AA4]